VSPRKKSGFPPSFEQLRKMGGTPPVNRELDPVRAAAGIEAARATVQQRWGLVFAEGRNPKE
jgi:hypothetical protein